MNVGNLHDLESDHVFSVIQRSFQKAGGNEIIIRFVCWYRLYICRKTAIMMSVCDLKIVK